MIEDVVTGLIVLADVVTILFLAVVAALWFVRV